MVVMNGEKFLRYVVYIGLGTALFVVPFLVTGSMFFPFITGKNIVFRIAVEVAAGGWLLLLLRNASYRPRKSFVLWAVLALLVITGVANLFGTDPVGSFWSNFERMDGYVTLLHFSLFFVVAASFLRTQEEWKRILNIAVVASVVMGAYGLLQIAGVLAPTGIGANRLATTFGNATYLAIYMLFHVFLTLFLLLKHSGKTWVRWWYVAAIVLQVFVLMKTSTRGAMLGVFGGLILTSLLMVFFEKEKIVYKKIARNSLIGLLLLSALFFVVKDTSIVQNSEPLRRVASISLEERTVRSRLMLWSTTSWEGFKERPLFGWGQENFGAVFAKHYNPNMYDQEPWFDRAHNAVFDWLIAAGVFGLLAYLSLFITALYYLWRPSSDMDVVEKSIFTGLLAGYFFHNMFVFDNVVSYILFGTVLAYIHSRSVHRTEEKLNKKKKLSIETTPMQYVAFIVVPLVLAVSVYVFAIKPARAANALVNGLRQQESLTDNLEFFKEAYVYNTVGGEEIAMQLFQLSTNVAGTSDIPNETKEAFLRQALEIGREEAKRTNGNSRHELFFGTFLMRLGLLPEALEYLKRAEELSPNKQQILTTLAQYYYSNDDPATGLSYVQKAYEAAPQFEGPAVTYASSLIRAGDIARGEQILEETFGTHLVTHADVINAYVAVGAFNRVRDLWNARVEENPDDASTRLSYAGILAQLGDFMGARIQAQKARELEPNLDEQVQALLDQIDVVDQ